MTRGTKKQVSTMREIARLAGVSQSTVSRVLNRNPSVDPELQAIVLKIMEEVNYRPNVSAQGLVSGKTRSIGLLTRSLGSPFFGEILRGATTELMAAGYSPIIALGSDEPGEDLAALSLLLERQADAMILQVGAQVSDDYLRELASEKPFVVVGRNVPGIEDRCVYANGFDAAYRATSYLIECGHTRIAHISGQLNLFDAVERRNGYCQALIDHGLPVIQEIIVEGDFTEAGGPKTTEKLLSRRPEFPFSAIFIANDQMAISARLALYRHGVAVPEDISLVGFDDLPNSQYLIPPLTTIRYPAAEMGVMAAKMVLGLLYGRQVEPPQLALELVIRESVAQR